MNKGTDLNYVTQKYGKEAVAQICTFGTMAARAVVRDVARAQGKSYGLADKLAKMIPFSPDMTLEKALDNNDLKRALKTDEQAEEIFDMARKLEGIIRNVGKHAAGVVIAPSEINDFSPLYLDEATNTLATQFDMKIKSPCQCLRWKCVHGSCRCYLEASLKCFS